MKHQEKTGYDWKYVPVGGVTRVKIEKGEDIAHLRELDQKKWTVLSCPVEGLEFDSKTLEILDADKDGRIHINDVVLSAEWLTSAVKDKDSILRGESSIKIAEIADEKLRKSAKQILSNLGLKKDSIDIADTSDSVAIFANTRFNGDGILPASAAEDERAAAAIEACINTFGGLTDRSGAQGVDADKVNAFYTALADYSSWQAASAQKGIFPYGENTEAALAACEALKEKIADYFMRCKLINFDGAVSSAVDVSADKVAAISDKNLNACTDEIASYPLARPTADCVLPFDAINPAWQGAFDTLKALVLDIALKGKKNMNEAQWNGILSEFAAYSDWKAAKKGAEVESLGLETINTLIAENKKDVILGLIEQDKALKEESESIDDVNKLLHLYRDFFRFLNNYVSFTEFYDRSEQTTSVFEAGKLYIDERCCNLCIKVSDMGAHADMAGQSGMFLIYCKCTSKLLGQTMDIAAVMTAGGIKNLRPGKNAIFYDRQGNDWDAVVTKIVDNPISIKQAFFSPYVKLWNFIVEKINKSAADKEKAITSDLQNGADNLTNKVPTAEDTKKNAFDIAKFAGIFAAIGMALGYIGSFLTTLGKAASDQPLKFLLAIVAVMICISGPSCFIAWGKLRKRNLGPVLNANGWAINSTVLVNILFGSTLTSVAKYPLVKGKDPFKKEGIKWGRVFVWALCILALLVGLYLYCRINGCCPCCCGN